MENEIDMAGNSIFNLKDPEQVDQATNKKYVDTRLATKFDKGAGINKKNHLVYNLGLPSNPTDAACTEYVNYKIRDETDKKFVKVDGAYPMTGNFDLNDKEIINLATDGKDLKSATNMGYLKSALVESHELITKEYKNYLVPACGLQKDTFRYLMEDADESSSENNINVMGIRDFPKSPHQVNKKAYVFSLVFEKDTPNQYRSRIGFNLHPLPVSYYTLVVEYFPLEMTEVSMTPQATTASISSQTTKEFTKYTKSLIHFHRWNSSPPQYLYLDLHGTISDKSSVTGRLVVYGVQGTVSSFNPSVCDTAFVVEKGQMVMQTDLSLNNHHLLGSVYNTAFTIKQGKMVMQKDLSLNNHRLHGSIHYIHRYLDTSGGKPVCSLNGCDKIIVPNDSHISTIKVHLLRGRSQNPPISLKIKHNFLLHKENTYTSTQATQLQTINVNLKLTFGYMYIELASVLNDDHLSLLVDYRVP